MAVMERIALEREYKVAEWLRHVYTELTQKRPFNFEELQPAEPYFESKIGRAHVWTPVTV